MIENVFVAMALTEYVVVGDASEPTGNRTSEPMANAGTLGVSTPNACIAPTASPATPNVRAPTPAGGTT